MDQAWGLALALTVILVLSLANPAPLTAGGLDFQPTDYTIRSVDGTQVIGHAHFDVTSGADGLSTVRGEYHFLDGDYDIDEATVGASSDGDLPRLVRSHHSFFHADGSPDRESRTDIAAGTGICTIYENGRPKVSSAQLDFPSDSFAGPAVIFPLRRFLKAGGNGSITFYDFNCIPGPKLLKVTARAGPPALWNFNPGDLVRVDVEPDFGWINVVIAPFLPRIQAWFDPHAGWSFVGGQSARYYKGLKYLMVRVRRTEAQIKVTPDATVRPIPEAQLTSHTQPTPP